MYQQNHKQLKSLLSVLLSIAISLVCIIPNMSIRSFADNSITVTGPADGTVFNVLSGTAVGSSESCEGALFTVSFSSENELKAGSLIISHNDSVFAARDNTNPKSWVFWGYTTAEVAIDDRFDNHNYNLICRVVDETTGDRAERTYYIHVVDPHTITFDPNGGNVEPSTATTNEYEKLASLPNATMEGQVFDGWYEEAEGGDRITTSTVFNESRTVYAHWRSPASPSPSPSPEKPAEENPDTDGLNSPTHKDNMGTPEDTPPAEDPNSYENFQKDTNKTIDNVLLQLLTSYTSKDYSKIENYQKNGIMIDAGNWQSFKEETYKKLDSLSQAGIPVTIKYTYNNKQSIVTIPGYLPISLTSLCRNGYCGFEYLRGQMNMYAALGFLPTASTAAVSSMSATASVAPATGNVVTALQVSAMIESALAANPSSTVLDFDLGIAPSLTADSLTALCEKNNVAKRIHFTHNGMKFVLFVPVVDPTSATYQQCKALLDAEPGKQAGPIRLSQLFAPLGFSLSGE